MARVKDMSIIWNHYTWEQDMPLDLAKLRAVEQQYGILLPSDYVDCVRENQGRSPDPANFRFGDGYETALNDLHHYEDDPADSNIVRCQQRMLAGGVPNRLFAFASDPAGNPICFDYRTSDSAPTIAIVDYERSEENAVLFVAESFTALLESLH